MKSGKIYIVSKKANTESVTFSPSSITGLELKLLQGSAFLKKSPTKNKTVMSNLSIWNQLKCIYPNCFST